MRLIVPVVAAALLVLSTPVHSRQSASPDLASVLRDVANYLEQYERDVVAVTAREDYKQISGDAFRSRQLASEFLIFADPTGWVEFRDVFEVDKQKVRDRDERLMRLFAGATADAKVEGRRIAEESARFNLAFGTVRFTRTLNVPMTALRYLRRDNQSHSSFSLEGVQKRNNVPAVVIRFKEGTAMPPLVGSNDGGRVEGTFWIEPGVGRILRTALSINGPFVKATIAVEYAEQPTLRLWLPGVMEEKYEVRVDPVFDAGFPYTVRTWEMVTGRATYTNYKQFKVETSDTVKE